MARLGLFVLCLAIGIVGMGSIAAPAFAIGAGIDPNGFP
jgi:hypothetical protein